MTPQGRPEGERDDPPQDAPSAVDDPPTCVKARLDAELPPRSGKSPGYLRQGRPLHGARPAPAVQAPHRIDGRPDTPASLETPTATARNIRLDPRTPSAELEARRVAVRRVSDRARSDDLLGDEGNSFLAAGSPLGSARSPGLVEHGVFPLRRTSENGPTAHPATGACRAPAHWCESPERRPAAPGSHEGEAKQQLALEVNGGKLGSVARLREHFAQ